MLGPLQLRQHSRVTWLELFFDLVFVAAVSQVASPLHHHYDLDGLLRLTPLLVLIWWAWTGYSVFATRFDTDDAVQRGLTLVQMFVVAVMAANARDALDSRSSAGFAAAYAVIRLILVAQYARARAIASTRALATHYMFGHGFAALVWLGSAVIPAPARFVAWGIAFAIDLGTPWVAVPHSVKVPPDAAHLPERFGLFTLILLGESVVALMRGIESQEHWPVSAAISAFLGMGLLFAVWWWYFDGIEAARERPVRTHRDAVRFHVWSYAHFPLALGIVVLGVGIERAVAAAAHQSLVPMDTLVMSAAAAVIMIAMAVIAATSGNQRPAPPSAPTIAIALAAVAAGLLFRLTTPVVLIASLTLLSVVQLTLALRNPVAPSAGLHPRP